MRTQRMMLVATAAIALVFLLTAGSPTASADTLQLTIGNASFGGGAYTPPFGTVTITTTGANTATVVFQMDSVGQYTYFMVDSKAADLNLSGVGNVTVSNLTANTVPGFQAPTLSNSGSGNVNGFGQFNLTIGEGSGFATATDMISFTLTTTGTYANAASVLTANPSGFLAAIHLGVCDTSLGVPCYNSLAQVGTGYASNGSPVPDGGVTLMLLGGALIGLAGLRRGFRA